MPQFLSAEAQSLLRALFKRNPANRLGGDRFLICHRSEGQDHAANILIFFLIKDLELMVQRRSNDTAFSPP